MARRYQSSLFGKRLPVEPLRMICERRHRGKQVSHTHVVIMSEVLGIAEGTIHRWYQDGGVPMVTADRAAVSLGLHPGLIWDEWWNV